MTEKQNEKQICPRSKQPCIYEKCEWYIGYPHFEMDCAINQIAYALMVLASFGPKGAKEIK